MSVVIETTLGDITIDLFLKERPNTCLNFLKLCKVKYYNFCVFYKIERNFIAQTGDPTSTGRGGESIFSRIYGDQAAYFEAELKPRLKHEKLGTLSMVNNGNGMNGSQFFLTLSENLTYLDEVHTVFGEVVEGFETLLKINEAICDPNNRPYQDILITHTVVLHDPYDDPPGLEIPDASPLPTKEQLESNYIRADEEIDDTKGKSAEEIEERIKESEAKARATILEMVGDIPDADVKPPETVLFVCKLNPVTTSEDLEIIFSRFGLIKSCEVIKDKKTGDSLQYAFIEFEKEEDCENAYFKMDNVLIDDRRIHVDFSQSVSKMMLDKGGKFPKNKNPKDMFVIKNRVKKSDGYDMIFDMDDEFIQSKHKKKNKRSPDRKYKRHESPSRNKKSPDRKYQRHESPSRNKRSPNRKYKRHESPSQKSNKMSRKRSLSSDRNNNEHLKSSGSYRSREHDKSKFTRDNTYKTSKDNRKKFEKRSSPSEDFDYSRGKQANYSSRNRHDSSDESGTTNSKIRTDYKSKHRNNSNTSNPQYASRNRHDSSNESDTTNSKIRADYKSKRHHNSSSSSRSVSPPKRQKHSTDKISSSKYSHSALKHQHRSHKNESHDFYESKEKKIVSRRKSSSSESDVPRQSFKIKSFSRSPEYSSQRTNKAKYPSSEKSRSHQRSISRKQSSSPESYSYKSNSQKVRKSHQQTSKSFNSSSPERKKQFNRSRSRSVSLIKDVHGKTKKSKKNKKRNKSSSSFSESDSNSSFQQKRNKTSHSKTHKSSQKDHKHRR